MEVTCPKAELVKGIQTVQGAISTRTTLPILSNLLLETKESELHLAATDLEIGIECLIPAKITDPGGVTIPARKIGEIIRELPEAEVKISTKDSLITIKCQKSVFKVSGLNREDFPQIPQLEKEKSFIFRQELLKKMLKRTSFAVSSEETRHALNGVLFSINENELKLVATDGRRLAYTKRKMEVSENLKSDMIIPIKAVNEISRILEVGDLEIFLKENQIAFCLDKIRIVSRLLVGRFADYNKVIPRKVKEKIVLLREPFLSTLKRVAILTSEKSNSVRLDISKGRMMLTAITPEVGEAKEELDLNYQGEDISIAFNPNYMLDFLKNEDAEEVYLELTDSLSPGLMRPAGEEKYLYVIMPMKL